MVLGRISEIELRPDWRIGDGPDESSTRGRRVTRAEILMPPPGSARRAP